ncbi:lantibiotic dehydratase [Paenibacillus sp. MMS20-IR301]|uniref:lantibiotic dehydratase n=1 Tax=Paenibacillus sp. MMS20-IR301 TaxID=2895946 RepID=UPI0028E9A828|nr:lantibiotic dehydratase [Paenibacillus sp. MMS20-IR301]WNS43478.1 lantibiotic dehydratase [Paenibacillus sp. MMS20-IR301]
MTISPVFIRRDTSFSISSMHFLMEDNLLVLLKRKNEVGDRFKETQDNVIKLMEQEIYTADEYARKKLLKLKRKIIKGEFPDLSIVETAELKHALDCYIDIFEKYKSAQQRLEEEFIQAFKNERKSLQQVFKNRELQNAVGITIGEEVYNKLNNYLDTNTEEHNRNLRKLDNFLLKFLTRASLKTSPLANLTITGVFDGTEKKSVNKLYTKLNYAVLFNLINSICLEESILPSFEYVINDTFIESGDFYYVTTTTSSKQAQLNLYNNAQQLGSIKRNALIDYIFKELRSRQFSYSDFHKLFRESISDEKQRNNILIKLMKSGFILRVDYFMETDKDLLENLIQFLYQVNYRMDIIGKFERLHELCSPTEVIMEFATAKEIYLIIEELSDLYQVDKVNRKNMLYIDYIKHDQQTDSNHIADLKPLLEEYQYLTLAFDPTQRSRYVVSRKFNEKFGETYIPGNNKELSEVLRFIGESIQQTEEANIFNGIYPWNKIYEEPVLNQYNQAAKSFMKSIEDREPYAEIIFTLNELKHFTGPIREITKLDLISHSFFYQHSQEFQIIILNHIYRGYSNFMARFMKYGQVNPDFRTYISEFFDSKNIMDLQYSYGFNANIRDPIVSRNFILPYDNGQMHCADWNDVYMYFNKQNGLLEYRDKKTDEQIRPLFLGTLISAFCPPIQNVFDLMSSHGTIYSDFGEIALRMKIAEKKLNDIVIIPRISIGDVGECTISRKKWLIKTSVIKIEDEHDDFHIWEKLNDFLEKQGIGGRFYVRNFLMDLLQETSKVTDAKPQFINMSSVSLFRLLKSIINNTAYILIEEEHPVAEGDYISEYIIENTIKDDIVLC